MKTQTFGIDTSPNKQYVSAFPEISTSTTLLFSDLFAQSAVADYRKNRENGEAKDNPSWDFPQDGKCYWSQDWGSMPNPKRYWRARYDQGLGDQRWMEEKDRNYSARLQWEKDAEQRLQQEQELRRCQGELGSLELCRERQELEQQSCVAAEAKMKTQNFGLGDKCGIGFHRPNLDRWNVAAAVANYRKYRENGEEQDNPSWNFPLDGKCHWSLDEGDWRACYHEGPGDRKWMEEKDRNYLARLQREKDAEQRVQQEQERRR